MLIAARQGLALRRRVQGNELALTPALEAFAADLEQRIAFVDEDRALDADLLRLVDAIRERTWSLYEA
jgi:histidine ammonia-lyase